jgi:signal peptide peptidase SppA
MGLWCIDDRWFREALHAVLLGLAPKSATDALDSAAMYDMDSRGEVLGSGLALVPIVGPITKAGSSKFGEASSRRATQAIKAASRAPDVHTVMGFFDSPGGTFSGTNELAQAFRDASKRYGKRTVAHIEDLGDSAAYYVASQADLININPTGRAGSIGVVGSVVDSSEYFELQGLKVHLYSTGPYKGMGFPGTKITPEHDAAWQKGVEEANAFFLDAVTVGREGRMSREDVEAAATGLDYGADEALERGLVDQISFFDDFLEEVEAYGSKVWQPNQKAASHRSGHGG